MQRTPPAGGLQSWGQRAWRTRQGSRRHIQRWGADPQQTHTGCQMRWTPQPGAVLLRACAGAAGLQACAHGPVAGGLPRVKSWAWASQSSSGQLPGRGLMPLPHEAAARVPAPAVPNLRAAAAAQGRTGSKGGWVSGSWVPAPEGPCRKSCRRHRMRRPARACSRCRGPMAPAASVCAVSSTPTSSVTSVSVPPAAHSASSHSGSTRLQLCASQWTRMWLRCTWLFRNHMLFCQCCQHLQIALLTADTSSESCMPSALNPA